MINPLITKAHILKMYNTQNNSIHRHSFYTNLTSLYSFSHEDEGAFKETIDIEPSGSILGKLLQNHYYSFNHDLTKTIGYILRAVVEYGKVYLEIQKETIHEENGKDVICALKLKVLYGEIKWKTKYSYIVYVYNHELKRVSKRKIPKDCLIVFDLKDIGLKRSTFSRLLKKLNKNDITKRSTRLLEEVPEYDFACHMNHADLQLLKQTREIGWTFRVDTLTDSHILYRKIKQEKLKIQMLDYILEKLNEGLCQSFCQDNCTNEFGEIVANIKRLDYDDLWSKYSNGELSTEQLSNSLFI